MTDSTALARQNRRLVHMGERGLKRTTVVVHEKNEATLELLRPHFSSPESAGTLSELAQGVAQQLQTVNVAQVQQLSPFRYAGGKTWLVPDVPRSLLSRLRGEPSLG
jgi:DNA adenine methylase